MRSLSKRLLLPAGVALFSLIPLPALAERTQAELVIVRPEDVITEDLYAAGNAIRVEGRIEGDLYAAAFTEVLISGEVTGDVVAMAGRVEVTGTVGGSLRATAINVIVSGSVADDLVVASWSTALSGDGKVGRDLLSWSRRISSEGAVGRNLEGQASMVTIMGPVANTVDVVVDGLSLADSARIGGDLIYQSEREAEIGGATVGGSVIRRSALPPNVRLRGLLLLTYTLAILGTGALAMALTWVFPRRVAAVVQVAHQFLQSWLAGVLVVLSPLVALGILALLVAFSPPEAGLPLALVLLPMVLGLFGVVVLTSIVGVVPVAGMLGRRLLPRRSVAAWVLAGLLLVAVIAAIPVVRWIAALALVPLGIGAWVRHLDLTEDLPAP